nr:hypothetical protein [Streptomyces sp. SID5468]
MLVVNDCPSQETAAALLRHVLDEAGLPGTPIRTVTVTSQRQAEGLGFTGSPTIRIDGRDPFAEPGRPAGLSCRLYPTASGLAGLPEPGPLRQALERAARTPHT